MDEEKEDAKERGGPIQDDVLPYLLEQILNILFHSANIAEIYADDVELRKKITPILRKHMDVENDLDREVRTWGAEAVRAASYSAVSVSSSSPRA